MKTNRIRLGLLTLTAVLVINIVYWRDPWLLRNYVIMMTSGSPTDEERLRPEEPVRGDGSFVLPLAAPADRTISVEALSAMRRYAAAFGSHALIVIHRGTIQDEIVRLGPALGPSPIQSGFDVSVLVNTAPRGMQTISATTQPSSRI